MIYPPFLKKSDTIGICAPSAGVGHKLSDYLFSIENLESHDLHIKETAHVRCDDRRSASAQIRGKEVTSLFSDPSVQFVMCATGGDFLDECLPYVDFQTMQENPKWLMGASDPTGILYPYTTMCDVATIYGLNAGSYAEDPEPDYVKDNLRLITGQSLSVHSYPRYMSIPRFQSDHIEYDRASGLTSSIPELHLHARCIGGCIDVLKDLIGTRFDHTSSFLKKYKNDGFIWYFDNFSLSAEVFYRTLLQMRYAGWFEGTKAVIVGRTLFESSETGMSYSEALERAFPDIPYIHEADIGHTVPHMTMINGALMNLDLENSRLQIKFDLH